MPRNKQIFRRTDLTRAIKAVRDAGLSVSAVRISPQGAIEVETVAPQVQDSEDSLDNWMATHAS
jgi:hypothetical protein